MGSTPGGGHGNCISGLIGVFDLAVGTIPLPYFRRGGTQSVVTYYGFYRNVSRGTVHYIWDFSIDPRDKIERLSIATIEHAAGITPIALVFNSLAMITSLCCKHLALDGLLFLISHFVPVPVMLI